MRDLHEKMEKATKDGKPEEAQRLKQELEAVRSKMYAGYASSRSTSAGDCEARMMHLRAVAENLKAAGARTVRPSM